MKSLQMKIKSGEKTLTLKALPSTEELGRALRGTIRGARRCKKALREDLDTIRKKDPAAKSDAEVLLLYSGFHAVLAYRVAHALAENGHEFAARLLSQSVKSVTGVEIHPAAKIGKGLFIDHGSGVVIGKPPRWGTAASSTRG